MKLIREFDDFGWAKSNIINPWILGYTGIHFDVEPTRENINELIEMALSLELSNGDKYDYSFVEGGKSREDDIDIILDNFNNGSSYLGINIDRKLGYGERKDYYDWKNIKWIEYSKLIDNGLNENKKDDGFGWAREVPLTFDENHQPSVGDVLICLSGYQAEPEDGVSEKDDPNCAGRGYADGRIIVVGEVVVFQHLPEGKRIVVWPDIEASERYWNYDDDEVCFDCGVYGFALTYYTDTLVESDEDNSLDWIINTDPNIPVHFNNVVVGRTYRVEPTEVLYDAIVACDRDIDIYFKAKSVRVEEIDYETKYSGIFCGYDREDEVVGLQLYFYDEDGYGIGGFWVADDMVTLYESYNTINENTEEEDNSLDWIINTDPNVPIPFYSVLDGKTYRAEPTEVLFQAIEACNGDTYMYNNIETAYVKQISYHMPYNDIFCDSDRTDEVIGLRLEFYGGDGSLSGSFWVTDDMVNLYEHYGKLTENTEDEWSWAKEIEPGIKLETNTLYYFEPKLTVDEIEFFGNNITNAPKFKEWLLDIPNRNSSVRTDGGITYFITKPDLPIRVGGFCTETSIDYARRIYPGVKVVYTRQTFNL